MEQDSKSYIGAWVGYIGIALVALGSLEVPQVYYAYAEYDAISTLFGFIPSYATVNVLLNIFLMPVSWTVGFASIAQMLQQTDLPFNKKNFTKGLVGTSLFLMLICIINMAVFIAVVDSELTRSLVEAIPLYTQSSSDKQSWDRATSLMQCCGASGPADWISSGFPAAPCAGYTLGCVQAIRNVFFIVVVWSIIAQLATILIAFNGVCQVKIFEILLKKWNRLKSKLS